MLYKQLIFTLTSAACLNEEQLLATASFSLIDDIHTEDVIFSTSKSELKSMSTFAFIRHAPVLSIKLQIVLY